MRPTRAAATAATLVFLGMSTGFANAQPGPPPGPSPAPSPAPSSAAAPAPSPAAAPDAAPAGGLKTTIDADGTYAVGTDIAPGTYASAGPIQDGACYWKRTSGDKIVDNALTKKAQVVAIDPTDTSFTTNDCQAWALTNQPPPPQAGPQDLLGQLGTFLGPAILGGGGAPPPPR